MLTRQSTSCSSIGIQAQWKTIKATFYRPLVANIHKELKKLSLLKKVSSSSASLSTQLSTCRTLTDCRLSNLTIRSGFTSPASRWPDGSNLLQVAATSDESLFSGSAKRRLTLAVSPPPTTGSRRVRRRTVSYISIKNKCFSTSTKTETTDLNANWTSNSICPTIYHRHTKGNSAKFGKLDLVFTSISSLLMGIGNNLNRSNSMNLFNGQIKVHHSLFVDRLSKDLKTTIWFNANLEFNELCYLFLYNDL